MSELVTTNGKNELAEVKGDVWGAASHVDAGQLEIPKIFLQQKMSHFQDTIEGAKPGEWRDSLDGSLLAPADGTLPVVVFDRYDTRYVFENDKFLRVERIGASNFLPPTGPGITSMDCANFLVLLVRENVDAFPYVISLKVTNMRAARRLTTVFAKMRVRGLPSAAKIIELRSVKQQNNKGVFWTVDFTVGGDTPASLFSAAKYWHDQLRGGARQVVVHEDEPRGAVVEDSEEYKKAQLQF